jgi:RND family efflux transporter MFP subunit
MKSAYFGFGVIIVIAVMLTASGCREKVKPGVAAIKREKVSGIVTATIRPSTVVEYYETSGTVRAKTVSTVSSRMMGTVTSVKVKEGDRVAAGQLLLTIDDRDIVQKVKGATEAKREAEKALAAAREKRDLSDSTYRRYKKLFDDKALSGQELDQIETQKKVADIDYERAEAAVQRAEAGVSEARVYRDFTRVVSPVRGVVTEKKTEPGNMAVPGAPLFTIEDVSSYRIEIGADETLAGRIKRGMRASAFIGALGRHIDGVVTEIVPSVDPASRSFLVKIGLPGEGLRNGLYAKVSLPVGEKEALLVPPDAVVERGQLTGIYTVGDDSVITFRLVRIGRTYGERVEILSGLDPERKIIVRGVEKAIDGGLAVETGKNNEQ